MIKRSLIATLPAFFYSAKAISEGSIFTSSYNDCVEFFHLFDYTYTDDYTSFLDMVPYGAATEQGYETVTCSFPGSCPDGVTRNSCTWLRYLGVDCWTEADPSITYYNIATNSLPNHCYYATNNAPIGSNTFFDVYTFGGVFNNKIKNMEEYDPTSD